jgi:hypothetical protein
MNRASPAVGPNRTQRVGSLILLGLTGLLLACLAAAGLSALSNRNLPTGPAALDRLDPLDKARLQETLSLKQELGSAVWPGWEQADIPIILWNDEFSFLVSYANPPEAWELVAGDDFDGQPYYRQPTHDPQNFAVRVGERWVASMGTKWGADNFLITKFREMMPGPLKPVFPYRLLIQPSEVQMTGVLHESFHVYQAQVAPAHLERAESAYGSENAYWAADQAMHAAWEAEINLLARAVSARSNEDAADLARQFLAQRDARRTEHSLDSALVDFERLIEWEEGLAKYVELSIWRVAADTPDYAPLPALADDPDFRRYATYDQRWSQELDQMKRQAKTEGDVRFYYTGMAQATLLDRLMAGWKDHILSEDVALEDLMRDALALR